MRTIPTRALLLPTVCLALSVFVGGKARPQQLCSVIPAPKTRTAAYMFSIQQERILGDIEAEWVENNYQAFHAEDRAAHLNAIVARVVSQFPHDLALVQVILIDTPEAGSFGVGPERIYITRKMVALLRNDDELAGLLGHELAHILTHHNAIIVGELFHEILHVNAVSGRKDISEKLMRLVDSINRDPKLMWKAAQIIDRQEGGPQNDADRVALYAMAAAGFSPQAYVDLFDRAAGMNGNGGNILTDVFADATSERRRFREIKKNLSHLPPPCRDIPPADSTEFRTWQAAVISDPHSAW